LTLTSAAGVNFLDKNFSKYIEDPADCIFDNSDASAIGLIFELFANTGMSTWYRKNIYWFLVYLVTEIGATPHNIRQGYNAPSVMNAYRTIVHDLVCRKSSAGCAM